MDPRLDQTQVTCLRQGHFTGDAMGSVVLEAPNVRLSHLSDAVWSPGSSLHHKGELRSSLWGRTLSPCSILFSYLLEAGSYKPRDIKTVCHHQKVGKGILKQKLKNPKRTFKQKMNLISSKSNLLSNEVQYG